jgi:PAS domain S-box-containing protein
MHPDVGFLESEFERALTARTDENPNNIIELGQSAQSRQQERERRFHRLLDALPTAIYTTDAAGRLTYFNGAAAEIWGQRPQLGTEWCGSWKLFLPDGTPLAHAECPMAVTLRENRAVRGVEMIAERPDGSRVPIIPYPTPLHDNAGRMIGAVNMIVDISDRKRAEAEHSMLVREVHHRVRNTLAIAQAIVGSTAKTSETIEGFKDALIGRISALARTHLLMSDATRTSVSFEVMLRNELDPFDDSNDGRVRISGPPVEIATRQAVPLGMALHELTTNAAKYGALATLGGRVDVSWCIVTEATKRKLEFDWVETGGPLVTAPSRKGFGTQLLEVVLPRQINAETEVDFCPEGLQVHVSIVLPDAEPSKTEPHKK